jgi:hypothetical protein
MRHVCSTVTVPETRTERRKREVRKNEAMNKSSKSLVSGRQYGSTAKSVTLPLLCVCCVAFSSTLGTRTGKQLRRTRRLVAHVPLLYVSTLTTDRSVYQQNGLTSKKKR